jgi:hypothetical protein
MAQDAARDPVYPIIAIAAPDQAGSAGLSIGTETGAVRSFSG